MKTTEKVLDSFRRLAFWCEKEGYKGYDPYDGLNSALFRSIPFVSKNRFAKLAWIQLFKRSPVNLRSLTGVEKGYNSKAISLFLSAFCNIYRADKRPEYLEKVNFFAEKLIELRNTSWSGSSWGYNFDWQARAFFQPKNMPTVVATTFAGCALADAYDVTNTKLYLDHSRSACDFILRDLNRSYADDGSYAFSYSPVDKSIVYNASLLGSRLLSRVYSYTHEDELSRNSRLSMIYCCSHQHDDGSWPYGKYDFHRWIDNFHTGFNLECISDYIKFTGDKTFEENLNKGLDYYLTNFITNNGVPKYYNNSVYPIDIHSAAQLIVTSIKNGFTIRNEKTDKLIRWTIDNLQSNEGYFLFQKNKYYTIRIPYMRWAQAWMFYAFSLYILDIGKDG
ncbi:MAG TPA: delta-aminolevulinic acid dehydratase [Bacteroidales bacterium]|nr:delta-aminolevulinic acid dehydratase [Bacteroidales bacterium]